MAQDKPKAQKASTDGPGLSGGHILSTRFTEAMSLLAQAPEEAVRRPLSVTTGRWRLVGGSCSRQVGPSSLNGSKGLIDSQIYIKVDEGLEWSAPVLTLSLPSDSINGLDKDLIGPLVKFADQSSGWVGANVVEEILRVRKPLDKLQSETPLSWAERKGLLACLLLKETSPLQEYQSAGC